MHEETSPSPMVASKRFIAGFSITGAAMTFLNLFPYLGGVIFSNYAEVRWE